MDPRRHSPPRRVRAVLRLVCAALTAAAGTLPAAEAPHWALAGPDAEGYSLEASGSAKDDAGAHLRIHSMTPKPGSFAAAGSRLDATGLAGKHVRITADLRAESGAPDGYLWLRIDGEKPGLLSVTGREFAVKPGAEWQARTLTLPVLPDARYIAFGVAQSGEGSMEARNVRIQTFEPGPPTLKAAMQLGAAIDAVRNHAYYSSRIDWNTTVPQLREWNRGSSGPEDVYWIIRELLTRLGDKHSSVLHPASAKAMITAGTDNSPVVAQKLAGGIVEVDVPGYTGLDAEAEEHYAAAGRNRIAVVSRAAPCGWIIDLRQNTGGNLWPMLGSLQAFFGNEPWGYSLRANGKRTPWSPPPGLLDASAAKQAGALAGKPVAVLIGPRTASAGEAVAIALHSRAHSRTFGEPSRGVPTANATITLPDGGFLVLTVALQMDLAGRTYDSALIPDESAEGDAAVDAAKNWLRSLRPQCAGAPARGKLPSNGGQLGTGRSGPG